jgi:hypothetical protein
MMTRLRWALALVMLGGVFAVDVEACFRRGCNYTVVTCCEPCCPPDTTPLHPQPHHPVPHSPTHASLKLDNGSGAEFYAIIYLRHSDPCFPCGVYRPYAKYSIPAGTSVAVTQHLYLEDNVLIETWWRENPTSPWHCYKNSLFCLHEKGTYHLLSGSYP